MRAIVAAFLAFFFVLMSEAQSPEVVVRQFVEAMSARNFDAAEKLVKDGKLTQEARAYFPKQASPELKVDKIYSKINGTKATVKATVSAPRWEIDPTAESVDLVKSGDSWLLVPEKGNQGILNKMVLACSDFKLLLSDANESKLNIICLANLMVLSTGLIEYVTRSKDIFDLSAKNWKSKIMSYVRLEVHFQCKLGPSKGTSYAFNDALSGRKMSKLKHPETLVMIYEGAGGKLVFHPDGKSSIGFVNGACKRVTEAEAKKLRWKP